MRGRLEGKNKMVSNLERDLTKATADNSSIRKKLDDVKMGQRAAMDDLRREKAKVMVETELEVVKARLEDANATNAEFSKTEEALNDMIIVLRGRIARLTEGAEDNKLTERILRAEISSLKSELQALEEQKEELRRSFRDSQSALSDSTEKVSALESDVVMNNKKLAMVKNSLAKEKDARAELVGDLKEERSKRRDVAAELELLKESSKVKVAPAGKRLNLANQKMIDLEDGIRLLGGRLLMLSRSSMMPKPRLLIATVAWRRRRTDIKRNRPNLRRLRGGRRTTTLSTSTNSSKRRKQTMPRASPVSRTKLLIATRSWRRRQIMPPASSVSKLKLPNVITS